MSTAPKGKNVVLQAKIDGLMFSPFHTVVGEPEVSQIIVSELDKEIVDFSDELCNRVLNIVPFKDLNEILQIIDDSRQTVGVFPPKLRKRLRNSLSQRGVQRVVDLGAAARGWMGPPHDGMRVMSRMATWVAEEVYETSMTTLLKE